MSWTKDQAAGAAPHTRGSLGEARCEDETGTPRSEGKYQPPQTPRRFAGTHRHHNHLAAPTERQALQLERGGRQK